MSMAESGDGDMGDRVALNGGLCGRGEMSIASPIGDEVGMGGVVTDATQFPNSDDTPTCQRRLNTHSVHEDLQKERGNAWAWDVGGYFECQPRQIPQQTRHYGIAQTFCQCGNSATSLQQDSRQETPGRNKSSLPSSTSSSTLGRITNSSGVVQASVTTTRRGGEAVEQPGGMTLQSPFSLLGGGGGEDC